MSTIQRGNTLLVARTGRLARSLAHPLQVVEAIRAKGAHFRSLGDPIDTTGPSGVLVLQMLGGVAEFERNLIRERTKAGIAAAKARGRVAGSPGHLTIRSPADDGRSGFKLVDPEARSPGWTGNAPPTSTISLRSGTGSPTCS